MDQQHLPPVDVGQELPDHQQPQEDAAASRRRGRKPGAKNKPKDADAYAPPAYIMQQIANQQEDVAGRKRRRSAMAANAMFANIGGGGSDDEGGVAYAPPPVYPPQYGAYAPQAGVPRVAMPSRSQGGLGGQGVGAAPGMVVMGTDFAPMEGAEAFDDGVGGGMNVMAPAFGPEDDGAQFASLMMEGEPGAPVPAGGPGAMAGTTAIPVTAGLGGSSSDYLYYLDQTDEANQEAYGDDDDEVDEHGNTKRRTKKRRLASEGVVRAVAAATEGEVAARNMVMRGRGRPRGTGRGGMPGRPMGMGGDMGGYGPAPGEMMSGTSTVPDYVHDGSGAAANAYPCECHNLLDCPDNNFALPSGIVANAFTATLLKDMFQRAGPWRPNLRPDVARQSGKFGALPWRPGMSRFSTVYQNENRWAVMIGNKKHRMKSMEEAENFFESEYKRLGKDPNEKIRRGYREEAPSAIPQSDMGAQQSYDQQAAGDGFGYGSVGFNFAAGIGMNGEMGADVVAGGDMLLPDGLGAAVLDHGEIVGEMVGAEAVVPGLANAVPEQATMAGIGHQQDDLAALSTAASDLHAHEGTDAYGQTHAVAQPPSVDAAPASGADVDPAGLLSLGQGR